MKTIPTRILLLQLISLLLSVQNTASFVPYSLPTRDKPFVLSNNVAFRPKRGQWRAALCAASSDDDEDGIFDDDSDVEYGKYELESKMHRQEEEDSVQALPEFLKDSQDDGTTASPSSPPPVMDDTQRRIEEQQRQIDQLIQLVQQQQQTSPSSPTQLSETPPITSTLSSSTPTPATTTVTPLKAMLFIDGTWLYYSIHERSQQWCPIVKKYGRGWQTRYRVDWAELIRVISEQLRKQHAWNSQAVEISRASVYTSCKKDTSIYSNRIKMFEEMKQNNYDVFMMETVGPGEKCVDIQLAVEMLHYATVPNAYDVAILLSGDKDFLPALIRTRQKARKVAIVSMRRGCNRALYETANVKDYDVIWIDDWLDRIMVPRDDGPKRNPDAVSIFTLSKLIYDFIKESGLPRVSSRDIGRFLKQVKTPNGSLLDEMKQDYGGLFQFLVVSGCFDVVRQRPRDEILARRVDRTDRTFWASLQDDAERLLLEEAKLSHLNAFEKEFFKNYSLSKLIDDESYFNSRQTMAMTSSDESSGEKVGDDVIPEQVKQNFSTLTVARLKEECRRRGLPVSGTKAVLVERIQANVDERIAELRKEKAKTMPSGRIDGDNRGSPSGVSRPLSEVETPAEKYLAGLVTDFIKVNGGRAGSRDIGRFLSSNSSYASRQGTTGVPYKSALTELKEIYGGLSAFIKTHDSFEEVRGADEFNTSSHEFQVALREHNFNFNTPD